MDTQISTDKLAIIANQKVKERDYWTRKLTGEPRTSAFPPGFGKKAEPGREDAAIAGPEVGITLEPRLCGRMLEVAGKSDYTLHVILIAGLAALLNRYTGQPELLVVTPIYKQESSGEFINTLLPLCIRVELDATFKSLLLQVKQEMAAAIEHQAYPILYLMNRLHSEQNLPGTSPQPRLETGLLFENIQGKKDIEAARANLLFSILRTGDKIEITARCDPTLFSPGDIEQKLDHYQRLLSAALDRVDAALASIDILSPEEKARVVREFNRTHCPYFKERTIHSMFEEQVKKTPHHRALNTDTGQKLSPARPGIGRDAVSTGLLTYSQLDREAERLSAALKEKGLGPGGIAAIMIERSLEMMIAIFAVLKAGAAYLPIDPQAPPGRKELLLRDSAARLLISAGGGITVTGQNAVGSPGGPAYTQLAYIIYTSGSTGVPKGVMIEHHSVINRLTWMQKAYPIGTGDVILQKTTYTFDVSVWELFWWSFYGASLHLPAPGAEKDPEAIAKALEKHKITTMHFVPSMLNTFLNYLEPGITRHSLASLKQVFASGEALKPGQVDTFNTLLSKNRGTKLINLYGPTEATVDVSCFDCTGKTGLQSIPIGKPIDNTALYILDNNLNPQSIGVPGQLFIAGVQLARGYLNRPELTAEKFITAPAFSLQPQPDNGSDRSYKSYRTYKNDLIYRTGDLARWLPDGNIEFLGRLDFQVKVRGFRIELGEIENRLLQHNQVLDAVVLAREDIEKNSGTYLCAYIVPPAGTPPTAAELRSHLEQTLPAYMTPAHFMFLDKIPLTVSGKVDRRALPEPAIEAEVPYAPPRDELERKLTAIWAQELGIEASVVGIDANFFHLGGHSLKATIMVARVHKELDIKVTLEEVFRSPTIRKLAGKMRGLETDTYRAVEAAEKREYYTLSPAQKRLYILQQMDINATTYNISTILVLEGKVDVEKLADTFKKLISRHESLRTSFNVIAGEPVQLISGSVDFKIESYAAGAGAPEHVERQVADIVKSFVRPFDLRRAPLMRVGIVTMSSGAGTSREYGTGGDLPQHVLMIDLHHIVTDGVSQDILTREFLLLYSGGSLPHLPLQYKDYSQWLQKKETATAIKEQEAYWLEEFRDHIPLLNLPLDFPRPPVMDFAGKLKSFQFDAELTAGLNKIAGERQLTLFMVLLAVYNVLLHRLSLQEDIVVGTPIAGRRHADLENIIGMFVNTLAMRSKPTGTKSFNIFLKEVGEKALIAFNYQDYQFEDLVDKVVKERDTSRNPIFDAVFLFQNAAAPTPAGEEPVLEAKPYDYKYTTAKFDLKLECFDLSEKLLFTFEYRTGIFKEETVDRFADYFERIARSVSRDPGIKIEDIDILSEAERQELLYKYNDTAADYPKEKTLHDLFADRAQLKGEHPAVIGAKGSGTLTYKQLHEQAEELAGQLRRKGVVPGDIVGLVMPRSVDAVVAIIAVLKAGAAFLPVDPETPQERVDFILKDSAAKVRITGTGIEMGTNNHDNGVWPGDGEINESFCGGPGGSFFKKRPLVAEGSEIETSSEYAYIIYTSGSTGKPKGVVISNRSAVNYIWWAIQQYVGDEQVDFPLFTSLSFDLTVTSVFTPLLSGNSVVVYPGSSKESLIEEVLKDDLVGVIKLTPSHLKLILASNLGKEQADGKIRSRVKRMILGGEALQTKLARDIVERFENPPEIYNEYGPTEATVGCMIYRFDPETDARLDVPVGIPAGNAQIYLLDNKQRPVPTGVPGEMYIGGDGLARGYLNRPKLTSEKFAKYKLQNTNYKQIPNPKSQTPNRSSQDTPYLTDQPSLITLYRTGDLARHIGDGNIEFLGRIDDQVKIRGFRIELGEIETALKNYRKNRPILEENVDITAKLKAAQRCTRCLLPGNFPEIKFDERGICNTCLEFDRYKERVDAYFKKPQDFISLLEKAKPQNKSDYDCLLLFSGGKDSTFVLYKLIDMGLKVLTFTFDNGFISDAAFANIKKTTTELGVENIVGRAKDMNKVFVESLNTNRSVCHGCWNAVNSMGVQAARERGINLVISGLSRGQIFEMRLEALFEQGIFDEKEIEENLLIFRKTFHSRSNKYSRIMAVEIPADVVEEIEFVDFFRYYDNSTPEIRDYLLGKGWVQPKDTGFCSSNCLINDVGIYVFTREQGYHFYAAQLSWDCRLGVISREQGLEEVGFESDVREVDRILKGIGYYRPPIEDAVVIDAEKEDGEKHLIAYVVTEEDITVSELRSYLSGSLPDYMIPANFVKTGKIPLTPAGKVDRKALAAAQQARLKTGAAYVAPGTQTEKIIAAAWRDVLGLDDVGVNDNFFDLGGTSFDIIKINSSLEAQLERSIPVVNLFTYPTVRSLADYLSGAEKSEITAEQEQEMTEKVERGKNRLKERARRRRN